MATPSRLATRSLSPMLVLAAASASAVEPPTVQQLLPFDTSACFVRDYDDAHPSQRVASLHLGALAGWNIGEGRDRPYHEVFVSLAVATRGGENWSAVGYCSDYDETNEPGARPGLTCDLPCDGDRFHLEAVDADTLALRSTGLRPSCSSGRIDVAADAVFRLRRAPVESCAALRALPATEADIQAAYRRARGGMD